MTGVSGPVQETLFAAVEGRRQPRLVASGDALAEAVAAEIAELQDGDPLREVIILTPPGPTADTIRRSLPRCNQGRGVAGVRFLTPVDLAGELLERAGRARRPLSPQVVAGLVERQLQTDCPPELLDVRRHAATVDALVELTERTRHVPARQQVWAALAGGSSTRRALLSVAAQARADIRQAGFADEATVLADAAELLGQVDPSTAIVIAVAEPFHPGQVPFVAALAAALPCRVVAVTSWSDDIDLPAQISQICATECAAPPTEPLPRPATLTSAPDQDEECRAAVRRVAALTTDPGAPLRLDRIAVLYPAAAGYQRGLTDELDRAGIPWSGPAPHTLADSVGGTVTRLFIDVVEQADRLRVFNLLAVAQHRTSTAEPRRDVDRWRRVARRAGVVTAADWSAAAVKLDNVHHADRRRRKEQYGEDPDERSLAREERERNDLDSLLRMVGRLRGAAVGLAKATSWAAAVDELDRALELLIGNERWRERRWAELPHWQHRAATQIGDGLRSLVVLDDPAIELPYSWAAMRRIVVDLLDKRVGRQNSATPGVRVHRFTDAACLDADVVLVLGANDGVLPGRPDDDLIVPRGPGEVSAAWIEHAEWPVHRATRAWHSLLRGSARVEVSLARSDMRRGGALYPSRLLPEMRADVLASHAEQVRSSNALNPAELLSRDHHAWKRSSTLRRRARSGLSRRLSTPTVFDGVIGARPELQVDTRPLSITSLENLAKCGVSYFLNTVLRVRQEDDPAETEKLAATDKGRMIHAVLEDIVRHWFADGAGSAYLDPAHYPVARQLLSTQLDHHAGLLRDAGLLGHPIRWSAEREMIINGLTELLDGERADGCTPVAVEHSFGMTAEIDALVVDTSAGPVHFRGMIDRIDHVAGSVRVTDFKTTNSAKPEAPTKTDPTMAGTKLQLHLYARVAHRDHGREDSSTAIRYVFVRNHVVTPKEVVLDIAGAEAWVDELARRINAGDFHAGVPHTLWGCADCSPDGLGLEHLASRAAHFAELAELARAAHRGLTEGDEE